VDLVWQKLKQQQRTCADQTRLESFWKHVRNGTPSKPAHSTAKQCQYALNRQDYAKKEQCNNPQCAYDATTLDLTEESATNKLAQALQSPDCRTVKATLEQLQVGPGCAVLCLVYLSNPGSLVSEIFFCVPVQAALSNAAPDSTFPTAKLGKSLLRCFDNRAETCRDLSVSCFTRLLQIDPDMTLAMLPYAVPVLGERLQASEVSCWLPRRVCQLATCSAASTTSVQLSAFMTLTGRAVSWICCAGVCCAEVCRVLMLCSPGTLQSPVRRSG